MAVNYGITFCRKVLRNLEKMEDQMFKEKGHGFDITDQAVQTEAYYRKLLKKFEEEKRLGLNPSYDPELHGTWDD